MFDAPPLPTVSQTEDVPLQKYRASLQCQLSGRVSLLDNVLKTLEKCAAALQEDLLQVLTGDDADTTYAYLSWICYLHILNDRYIDHSLHNSKYHTSPMPKDFAQRRWTALKPRQIDCLTRLVHMVLNNTVYRAD